jgi:rubrerythrin
MEKTIKSIEIALENELREREFYLKHRKRTQTLLGRMMFAQIAREEDEHYQRLKNLHEELSKQGKWPENISAVKGTNIITVLKDVINNAEESASPDTDDREAVNIAIAFETEAYNFYSKLKDNADTESEKDFFNRLSEIENEHLTSLKETRDYFDSTTKQEKPDLK